jgi:L-iditol 2-dehydrogenase
MKAIVNTKKNVLEMLEVSTPEPDPGQVRIRTTAVGICATDLEMIGGWSRTDFGSIPGHEWSGVVDSVGKDVEKLLEEKKCVASNIMSDGGEVGFEHPGGYGQYLITMAENVYVLPDDFPMHTAVLIEPLAVCIRALHKFGSDLDEPVLIFGDGPIGLILVQLLKLRGITEVILVGGRKERLEMAAEFGAFKTINYHQLEEGLAASLRQAGAKDFESVIECSGSLIAAAASIDLAKVSGKIVLVGDYGSIKGESVWQEMLLKELTLIGSNASADAWPEAVELATSGKLDLEKMISQRLAAQDFQAGIEFMNARRGDVTKVVLEWT